MSLTVNNKIIAEIQAQPVTLSPLLGAYELIFPFTGTIHAKSDGYYRWLTLENARVTLKSKGGHAHNMGLAYPDSPTVIRQNDFAGRLDFALKLVLMPHQIELLEAKRDGGDLDFAFALSLKGSDSQRHPHEWPEYEEIRSHVPQSAWVAQINVAKADNILLFEVHLPLEDSGAVRHPAHKHLTKALELYRAGKWRPCVAECRLLAEELGVDRIEGALNRLKGERKQMTKEEREAVLVAALKFYGDSGSHSESQHGTFYYERKDAKLALSIAAGLLSHQTGG